MTSWICDGKPKNGKQYPNCSGEHEPQENQGPDCVVCGLPKEAMEAEKTRYVGPISKPNWLIPGVIVGGILLALVGGWFWLKGKPVEESPPVAEEQTEVVQSPEDSRINALISGGEKILLDNNQAKTAGAGAMGQQNWSEAIAKYQQAVTENPNDPESQIYLNNAKARQQGTPLTLATVVPISASQDSAKEILRGVAQYQSEYNENAGGRLLEIVIVDQNPSDRSLATPLAQALIDNPEILAVLGYGADLSTKLAMQTYESSQLAVLSPINTQVDGSKLKLISINQSEDKLVEDYLKSVARTLLNYAQKQKGTAKVVIFYNSNSDYSNNLKQAIGDVLPEIKGELVEEIDINSPGFDPQQALNQASQNNANTAIIALSKDQVDAAISLAQSNQNLAQPLLLMGGDEMYNPDILVKGQDQIEGIILAVPWSAQPGDTFAQEALQLWKGKVSWRTKTAYDGTKILTQVVSQNPQRSDIYNSLEQGIELTDSTVNFSLFSEVPLVKATPGDHGPPGSTHGFTSL